MTDTFSNTTHSPSFNECAVAGVKAVSAREETRSAHAEISKMEVQDEGGQQRTAPKPRPQSFHEGNACLCLFLQHARTCLSCQTLSRLLQVLAFVFLSLWRLTILREWGRLFIVLVLFSTYRAQDKRMKSAVSAEPTYWTDDVLGKRTLVVLAYFAARCQVSVSETRKRFKVENTPP